MAGCDCDDCRQANTDYMRAWRNGEPTFNSGPPDERDEDWKADAACRGFPTDWWFPDKHASTAPTVLAAEAICSRCPVAAECLSYGLSYGSHGIWGGLSGKKLRQARRTAGTRVAFSGASKRGNNQYVSA
jgi:hypothetical protein